MYSGPLSLVDPTGLGVKIDYRCQLDHVDHRTDPKNPVCYYRCVEYHRDPLTGSYTGDPGLESKDIPAPHVLIESRRAENTWVSGPFFWKYCEWRCPTVEDFSKTYTHGRDVTIPVIGDSRNCSQENCRQACDDVEKGAIFCKFFKPPAKQVCKTAMNVGGAFCRDFCNSYCTLP